MGGTLFDLIGSVDNLDEPLPFFDKKSVIYGVVITCLVSSQRIFAPTTGMEKTEELESRYTKQERLN